MNIKNHKELSFESWNIDDEIIWMNDKEDKYLNIMLFLTDEQYDEIKSRTVKSTFNDFGLENTVYIDVRKDRIEATLYQSCDDFCNTASFLLTKKEVLNLLDIMSKNIQAHYNNSEDKNEMLDYIKIAKNNILNKAIKKESSTRGVER